LGVAAIRLVVDLIGIGFRLLSKHNGGDVFLGSAALLARVFLYWPMEFWLNAGTLLIAVKLTTAKKTELADLFPSLNRTLKYVAGSIVLGVIIFGGCLLLIVPGIILGIQYKFVPYLMADKLLPMREAFKLSEKMTDGLKWDLFRYTLNCVGIVLLGLVAFCVGVFWAAIVVQIASAYLYRTLLLQTNRPLALRAV
jgi:uncharacterized membrane protein